MTDLSQTVEIKGTPILWLNAALKNIGYPLKLLLDQLTISAHHCALDTE